MVSNLVVCHSDRRVDHTMHVDWSRRFLVGAGESLQIPDDHAHAFGSVAGLVQGSLHLDQTRYRIAEYGCGPPTRGVLTQRQCADVYNQPAQIFSNELEVTHQDG